MPTPPRSRTGLAVVSLLAVAVSAIAIGQYATSRLTEQAADGAPIAMSFADRPLPLLVAFYLHVGTGSMVLVIGAAQFSATLRTRWPRLHRVLGRCYLTGVAVAALAALTIAPFGAGRLAGFFGFSSLAVLWLLTGFRAYRAIRCGDVESHQGWMIRNYALTFAAPTLRIWLALLIAVQVAGGADGERAFATAYAAVPFLCWLPNLVVAEWLVRRRGLPSYRLATDSSAPSHVVPRSATATFRWDGQEARMNGGSRSLPSRGATAYSIEPSVPSRTTAHAPSA